MPSVAPVLAAEAVSSDPNVLERDGRWNPDPASTLIVFTRLDAVALDGSIWVADSSAGTAGAVRLTPDDGNSYKDPRWSPDGRYVLFEGETPADTSNLYAEVRVRSSRSPIPPRPR